MLCKIDCTIGTTDEKARAINFLRAVRTVMTAAANTSPTCNVVTAPGIYNGALNVITEVVSNVETGGWTATSDSNVADNYNASYGSYYQVDFVSNVQTGKVTYPYLKCTLTTNINQFFSGTYTTYPYMDFRVGFNNTTAYANTYAQAPGTVANTTANIITAAYSFTGVNTNVYPAIVPQWGEYLVASTSKYVALLNANGVSYFGYRTTNTWEDSYTDNPPIVAFSTHCRGDATSAANYFGSGGIYNSLYLAWMYTQGPSGNVSIAPQWRISRSGNGTDSNSNWISVFYNNNYWCQGWNPLSGVFGSSFNSDRAAGSYTETFIYGRGAPAATFSWQPTAVAWNWPGYGMHNAGLASPLMFMRTHSGCIAQGGVSDPVSGSQVPAAFPLVFQTTGIGAYNAGGTAIGIYKSSSGSDAFLSNIFTPGSSYTVGSDTFYGYRVGYYSSNRDIFLIRKA